MPMPSWRCAWASSCFGPTACPAAGGCCGPCGAAVILRLLLPEERLPKLRYPVPEEWFSDALILGNSHCGGLSMYGDMPYPDFCFSYGGSIFTGLSTVCRDRHERSFTLRSLLEQKQYATIILVYGTNEMGYDIY